MSAAAQAGPGNIPLTVSRFDTAIAATGPAYGTTERTTWRTFTDQLQQRRQGDKDGPNFVPARFRPEPSGAVRRLKENLLARTAIALDIETSKLTGEVPPSVAEAAARIEARGLAAALYSSHSHTAKQPRYRIVVPLSGEIAAHLPAVEVVADMLGLAGVVDQSKVGAASVFYLPSSEPGELAQHETAVIEGKPIDAAWMAKQAGAILEAQEADRERERAEAMEAAARRREDRIRQGFDPNTSLIEQIRSCLDLRGELLSHGYKPAGEGRYLYPKSETGVPGVYTMTGRDGVERVFSYHSADPLAAGNLPSWCRVKAVDVVDVLVILDHGGDLTAGLRTLAKRLEIATRPASTSSKPSTVADMVEHPGMSDEVAKRYEAAGARYDARKRHEAEREKAERQAANSTKPPPQPAADPVKRPRHEQKTNGASRHGEDQGENDRPPHPGRNRQDQTEADIVWPTPLDFLSDPHGDAPELRHDHIPPALNDFVFDTAARMGVDPTSVALSSIIALAAVASDEWEVQPKRHDYSWTEKPRLWGAIVGDPSILKTPVIRECTQPIDKLDAAARERHKGDMHVYKEDLKAHKADKTGETAEPRHPRLDRYLIENATIETIGEILRGDDADARQHAPAGKVLVRQDEMSEFFANLDRYRAGGTGGGDRGTYLRLYNGGTYTIDRIGRGSFSVPNWSAGFLGGIQPGPIQKIARDAAEDGLLQRFLFAVPGPQDRGVDREPQAEARRRYRDLFPALAALRPLRKLGSEHAQEVAFHADAHQHREAVDETVRIMGRMPDTTAQLQAAYGKWAGLFARVALTFHLIEIADAHATGATPPYLMVVSEETARRARAFMLEIALPHLLRAHRLMYSTVQAGHAAWITGYILANRCEQITTRDIIRVYRSLKAPEHKAELEAVMNNLVAIGWLEPMDPNNAMKPVNTWTVNPAVHLLFAERAAAERARRERAREDIAPHVAALRRQKAETEEA